MLFIVSLIIALFTAFILDKQLKKRPMVFYITAAVLTVASVVITQSDITLNNSFVRDYVMGMFSRGALGAAFWAVVMYAGALPNGSASIKKLMPIRGELSITAAVLTLAHIITFGMRYISSLMNGRTGSGAAFRDFVVTSVLSLAMTMIMLPLTVMSFKAVRRKMDAKTWKKIQRLAYLFYAMIYIHIMILFVPKAQKGREGYFLSVLVYSAVFIGYAVLRLRKYFLSKKENTPRLIPNAVCACAFVIPLCLSGAVSRNSNIKTKAVSSVSGSATETSANTQDTDRTTAVPESQTTSKSAGTTVTTTAKAEKTTETATDEIIEPASEAETANDQPTEAEHEEAPEQNYRFKNGTFEGTGEGYDGKVHVTITIENDIITSISATADADDPDFFGDAMNKVIPQIKSSLSADGVDACSGATYSSNGIIEAARNALEQALN